MTSMLLHHKSQLLHTNDAINCDWENIKKNWKRKLYFYSKLPINMVEVSVLSIYAYFDLSTINNYK